MADLFYKLGKKVGKSIAKGKFIYNSALGSKKDALSAEYHLGSILAHEIETQNSLFDSPYHQLLVESILKPLTSRVKNKQRVFHVKILKSHDLNAFALPGGFIFLTSNLVMNLEKAKDELAFVLAHEMVHIIARHPFKRMLTTYSMEAISRVFKAGSIVSLYGKDILKKFIHSQYSQNNEYHADEYGTRLIYSAGFDPRGSINLLKRFQQWKSDESLLNYFASHPSIEQRIKNLQKIVK